MKKFNPSLLPRTSARPEGRKSGSVARPRPASPYMGREERAAHRRSEALIEWAADMGIHPAAVSRRIQERLPSAWEVVPSRVTDKWSVTTAYNTKWGYHIDKESGGWVVRFVPNDLESRRTKGGAMGGFLTSRGLSYEPEVYATRKSAYDVAAQHAMKGRYLQYKNPKSARSGAKAHILGGVSTGRKTARSMLDRYDESIGMRHYLASHKHNPAMTLRQMEARIKFLRDEQHYDSDAAYAELQRLVSAFKAAGGLVKRVAGPYHGTSMLLVGSEVTDYKAGSKRRANPTDWALAYEGRLRDLTSESDGLIHVEYNPKGRRARVVKAGKKAKYVSAQTAGLARGQMLMAEATQAFHEGKYPTMAAALKGVAKTHR